MMEDEESIQQTGSLTEPIRSMLRHVKTELQNRRAMGEIRWVIFNKVGEIGLQFVAVKLFTNLMGKAVFGEYHLVLNVAQLVYAASLVPVHEAYLRYHYRAEHQGVQGHAGRFLLRWYAVVTVLVALLVTASATWVSTWSGLDWWVVVAGGFVFFGYQWRRSGVQILDLRRQRRAAAVGNICFFVCQITLVSLVSWAIAPAAHRALFVHAVIAGLFGIIAIKPFVQETFARAAEPRSEISEMVLRFGLPFGLLFVSQWVQGFGERFILWNQLEPEDVGLYIAAYQLCGVPYTLGLAVYRALLLPIAYQRVSNVDDARKLRSADKLLLLGFAVYLVTGVAVLPVYWLFGSQLLVILTNADFRLSATTIVAIAIARYAQTFGLMLDSIFAVHNRMATSLSFRLVGAVLIVPLCWVTIKWYGMLGAALGIFAAAGIHILLASFGPGGWLHLVAVARRAATGAPSDMGEDRP